MQRRGQSFVYCSLVATLLPIPLHGQGSDPASEREKERAVLADTTPDASLAPRDAVTALLISEEGEGQVKARVALGIGDKWTLGLDASSPFEKGQEEAEFLSIDDLGPGSEASLFATFSAFSASPYVDADDVCQQINRRLLDEQRRRRFAQSVGEGCPPDMRPDEWYSGAVCNESVLRCVGGDFLDLVEAEVEKVCLSANANLHSRFFHGSSVATDPVRGSRFTEACPKTLAGLEAAIKQRIPSAALPAALEKGGQWDQTNRDVDTVKKWVADKSKEGISGICGQYRTIDLEPLINTHGLAVECDQRSVTEFLDKKRDAGEDGWEDLRESVSRLNAFRQWLFNARYTTSKPKHEFLEQETFLPREVAVRPYRVGVDANYYRDGTLWTASAASIRRFKVDKKQLVCSPLGTSDRELCTNTVIGGPQEREFEVYEARARRFLGRTQRLAGVISLKYESDESSYEPHVILYALQRRAKDKPDGLNGGFDLSYNTEDRDVSLRLFVGKTFDLEPGAP